jgi:plastocyanin
VKPWPAVLALAAPSVLLASPASAACSGNVTVASFSYTPATLNVTRGTTVTWCWTGGPHSVTGTGFDDPPGCTSTGARCGNAEYTFSRVFSTAGTFAYHCKVHSSMQGSIVVGQPSPTPSKTTRPPTTPPATRTPTPSRTTTPPTTTPPPPIAPPTTTAPPTTAPPTTAAPPATTPPAPSATPLVLDPAPKKPRTGLAIGVGLAVAVLAFGGAAAVWLRGRRRAV